MPDIINRDVFTNHFIYLTSCIEDMIWHIWLIIAGMWDRMNFMTACRDLAINETGTEHGEMQYQPWVSDGVHAISFKPIVCAFIHLLLYDILLIILCIWFYVYIHIYIYIHTRMYVYIHIYIYICVSCKESILVRTCSIQRWNGSFKLRIIERHVL